MAKLTMQKTRQLPGDYGQKTPSWTPYRCRQSLQMIAFDQKWISTVKNDFINEYDNVLVIAL